MGMVKGNGIRELGVFRCRRRSWYAPHFRTEVHQKCTMDNSLWRPLGEKTAKFGA